MKNVLEALCGLYDELAVLSSLAGPSDLWSSFAGGAFVLKNAPLKIKYSHRLRANLEARHVNDSMIKRKVNLTLYVPNVYPERVPLGIDDCDAKFLVITAIEWENQTRQASVRISFPSDINTQTGRVDFDWMGTCLHVARRAHDLTIV